MKLSDIDPEIYESIELEKRRQNETLELIPSENFVSKAVMEATGSVLTNKYAEGYPKKRYYGGCHYVDIAEELAITRAKELFKADHANVQPHCGSSANMAVYMATLKPGDRLMGMDLAHGGHLTHGFKVSFSGKLYNSESYGVDFETERMDYDAIQKQAEAFKPHLIVCGASAYPRKIDFKKFKEIADSCGALLMADIAHIAGLVVAGLHESPVGNSHFLTTTTHKTLRGPRSGLILCDSEFSEKIDKTVMPGIQGGPLMHVIAAKAVCFQEALKPSFSAYQEQIVSNAKVLAESLMDGGLRLVTGGTDNHLMLVDLTSKGISGKKAEMALDKAGITVNKNMIPNDTRSPLVTSGIRLGTPAITTRGLKSESMKQIGEWIVDVINDIDNDVLHNSIRQRVKELCLQHPLD